jgi:ribose transport system permease protein
MSTTENTPLDKTPAAGPPAAGRSAPSPTRSRALKALAPRNIGAVYVWLIIIVLFSIIASDTFPTSQTAKSILNEYAITGLVALALVVPLAAGVYDLSIGYTMGLSGVMVGYLLAHTSMSPVVACLITLCACVGVGLLNAFVIAGLRVDSFIGTLGTGAILAAATSGLSGDQLISGRVSEGFSKLASTSVSGIALPVIYLLVIMLVLAYWLERTEMGRKLYAIGFDRETARLTGVPVTRLVTISFVTSAVISGFAGMVLTSRVSAAAPDAGTSYLIPAFSAAFLGATQIRGGRFNSWGTVIGVMLLGTGNIGLLLAGGPTWTQSLFVGTVLIAAVGLTSSRDDTLGARIRQRVAVLRSRDRPAAGSPS